MSNKVFEGLRSRESVNAGCRVVKGAFLKSIRDRCGKPGYRRGSNPDVAKVVPARWLKNEWRKQSTATQPAESYAIKELDTCLRGTKDAVPDVGRTVTWSNRSARPRRQIWKVWLNLWLVHRCRCSAVLNRARMFECIMSMHCNARKY